MHDLSVSLPYGKSHQTLTLPQTRVKSVLTPKLSSYVPAADEVSLICDALDHPIASKKLCELAAGKQHITIISSDHTRPVPSKLIMPELLRQIRLGNPQAEITILVAAGCHRRPTKQELIDKYGEDIVAHETIAIHSCTDDEAMRHLGTLPSGGACLVNKLACEADLLIAEGFIEPHFFAGFSGGRKSVLPGVASRQTVLANHCSEFIADPKSRAGSLEGNRIHQDMLWAAKQAGLAFIVNVVLDHEKKVIYAVAGDPEQAHAEGCRFLGEMSAAAAVPADIVVTTNGGYPLDQNIYQAVKGMTAAEACVKPGGIIIMLAAANDGHGGQAFFDEMSESPDLDKIMQQILSRGRNETLPDQWQAQIMLRVLLKATVIFVSEAPDEMVRAFHMLPAHSAQEALALADQLRGDQAGTVTIIPDGVSVIVKG